MIWDTIDVVYLKQQLDKLSNLNTSLTDVRDTISGGKSLSDIDSTLSTLATESTLSAIKAQTDKLTFDGSGNLLVSFSSGSVNIGNFPSWFTSSTKTTDDIESDISALKGALSSVGSDKFRVSIVDALPAGTNWIGNVGIGDGTNLASLVSATLGGGTVKALATAPDLIKMYSGGTDYVNDEITTSTTETSSTYSPALKFAILTNESTSDDIKIRFNGSSAPQMTLHAGTSKVVMYPISSIYYVAVSGSPVLKVNGFQ